MIIAEAPFFVYGAGNRIGSRHHNGNIVHLLAFEPGKHPLFELGRDTTTTIPLADIKIADVAKFPDFIDGNIRFDITHAISYNASCIFCDQHQAICGTYPFPNVIVPD